MGFCVIEQAEERGLFFAVNADFVKSVVDTASEGDPGLYISRIDLTVTLPDCLVYALGHAGMVERVVSEAQSIGLEKISVDVLGGRKSTKPTPFLISDISRVVLVQELRAYEITDQGAGFTTASTVYYADGQSRLVVQRPGVFAYRANVGRQVPVANPRQLVFID